MSNINDGGPAFPHLPIQANMAGGEKVTMRDGMTLRDYFAAKAMQGLVANGDWLRDAAAEAYAIADAMLAARNKK